MTIWLINSLQECLVFFFKFAWSKCLTLDLLLITFWVAWSNFVVSDDTCQFFPLACQPLTMIFVCLIFSFVYFLVMPVGVVRVMLVLALIRTAKWAQVLVTRLFLMLCSRGMRRNISNIWNICQFHRYGNIIAWFWLIYENMLFCSFQPLNYTNYAGFTRTAIIIKSIVTFANNLSGINLTISSFFTIYFCEINSKHII